LKIIASFFSEEKTAKKCRKIGVSFVYIEKNRILERNSLQKKQFILYLENKSKVKRR